MASWQAYTEGGREGDRVMMLLSLKCLFFEASSVDICNPWISALMSRFFFTAFGGAGQESDTTPWIIFNRN
jgi:hypothetical protein